MITATIGRIFLEAYNKKYGTKYDAKTFFVEVYYPLFFDNNKYMMTAGNTPLENGPKISWPNMIKGSIPFETLEQRKLRYDNFLEKVEIGYPTTDNAIGYASSDVNSTTSGQTSNLQYPFAKDEIYLSWIGAGLNVRAGKLLILFFEKQILLDIFEGWKYYRELLDNEKLLKGNQIESWNCQWLEFKYSENDIKRLFTSIKKEQGKEKYLGCIQLSSSTWTKLLIAISKHFQNPKMNSYIYDLGQTNSSIGFIPFSLEHIRKTVQLYTNLFGVDNGEKAESLWGTENGFRVCCQKGIIGVEAMQPEGLKKYFYSDTLPKIKNKDEDQIIHFKTYIIWLLAMLNNQELWEKSQEFAELLLKCSSSQERGKKEISQIVDDILSSKGRTAFIVNLTKLIPYLSEKGTIEDMGKIVNDMPIENVLYFLTLLKFRYELNKL